MNKAENCSNGLRPFWGEIRELLAETGSKLAMESDVKKVKSGSSRFNIDRQSEGFAEEKQPKRISYKNEKRPCGIGILSQK